MKYSIKKQMIAIFIGLLVCMVAVLLFINMTFLEPYYIHNKESSFQEMYEELGQVVEDQSYSDEKATSALLREAERNNMSFLIVDRATGNKYTNVHNEDLLLNQLLGYVINQAQKSGKMLESTDQYQMLQAQDPWNETEYLVMWGNFDDGSQFLMRSPLESMFLTGSCSGTSRMMTWSRSGSSGNARYKPFAEESNSYKRRAG